VLGSRHRGTVGSLVLFGLVAWIGLRPGPGADPAGAPSATTRSGPVSAFVSRVIDGDTIEVRLEGRTDEVRYIGIDTPETVKPDTPVQCFGHRASELNTRLVEGRQVRLNFDAEPRDIYGRMLAYVHLGRRFVNAILVRDGYARTLTIPPNDSRAPLFARLARRAAIDGRGLWGACRP
jgi:micrococcal nuclease